MIPFLTLLLYDIIEFCVGRYDRVEQRGGGVALFYKNSKVQGVPAKGSDFAKQ
ncbi:MAG: hypothetical protein GY820_05595 [Gammaproteobacteria bacterium]|nr:hypothetical protein [Gammaproteobacteria bacterium]